MPREPQPLVKVRDDWERVAANREDSTRAATEQTIEALAGLGRLEPVDDAAVAAVRNLATAVDVDCTNAALWAQFRAALEELTSDGDDDGPDPYQAITGRFAGLSPALPDSPPA